MLFVLRVVRIVTAGQNEVHLVQQLLLFFTSYVGKNMIM